EAFDMTNSAEATMNRLETLFEWQRERHAYPVWGICISVPSPVQAAFDDPYLSATPPLLPAWEGFPFVEKLTARFGAPVWLRSSVETMTMGELSAGGGSAIHNMLFVKVGKRIGAGMVLNGQLYRGAQGTAGLIGNLPIRTKDRTAQLEAHAGSEMIATEGWAAATDGRSPILAEILKRSGEISAIDVGQAAQTGDSVSMEIMSRSGRLIGQVVAALANMLNPSLIVLGGSAAQTNDILLAAVREAVYRDSHPLITRDLRISASKLGSSAGLVGAASVVVEALFDAQHLRNWVTGGSPTIAPDFRHVLARAQKMNSFNNIVDEPIPAPPTSIYR
ncbi:MAG: ROK family protein, partial [Paracoccaceae bacterium]